MKGLANQQTTDRNMNQLQSYTQQALNPILKNPLVYGNIVKSFVLQVGTNVINHGLGHALQGWSIVRLRAKASIYDEQDSNPNPDKTLILISDAVASIDVYCF